MDDIFAASGCYMSAAFLFYVGFGNCKGTGLFYKHLL